MKYSLGVGLAMLLIGAAYSRNVTNTAENIWKILFKVTWYKKYDPLLRAPIDYPRFAPEIQALNGKEITVSGYVIPSDLYEGEFVVLSAYPTSSCYFCGGAGPETVMEVYPKNGRKSFATPKVSFKGKLVLNEDDSSHLIYLLKDAVQVANVD